MARDVAGVARDSVSPARRAAIYQARRLGSLAFEISALVLFSRVKPEVWVSRCAQVELIARELNEALADLSFELDQLDA
jgi:hypothetical protein